MSTTAGFWRERRFDFVQSIKFYPPEDRDNIFIADLISLNFNLRIHANGLLNADGGVIYFGIKKDGTIEGLKISRAVEDDLRLLVDRTIGSFLPFVPPSNYRVVFHPVINPRLGNIESYVMEVKISAGTVGEIYEDGFEKLYLYANNELLGPLWPQEIIKLSVRKYQQSLMSNNLYTDFTTPALDRKRVDSEKEHSFIELSQWSPP